MEYSIFSLSTFLLWEALFCTSETHGNTWNLSLTESYLSASISTIIQTKCYQLSNTWRSSEIQSVASSLTRSNFYIEVTFFLSSCIVSNYGFTKMQRRVATWILGAFHTLPSFDIEAITDLIPIYLHLCKLSGRAQLKAHSLSHNYILQPLLESRLSLCNNPHCLLLNSLSPHQWEIIKGSVIDMDNRFNKVFSAFDLLHKEFSPSSHIIDIFPNCFSFHPSNKWSINNLIS